jgi:sec-independent protein translocase protein TatB
MFSSMGWGEIMVIALLGLFIFGPERLPTLVKDAAEGIKRIRAAVKDVGGHLHESVGGDFAELRDLDLRRYHPNTIIRELLLSDDFDSSTVPPDSVNTAPGSADGGEGPGSVRLADPGRE